MSCQDSGDLKRQSKPDFIQTLIIYAFYTLIALTLAGTIIDRYYCHNNDDDVDSKVTKTNNGQIILNHNSSLASDILLCFSLTKNWRTFTSQSDEDNSEELKAYEWYNTQYNYPSSTSTSRNSPNFTSSSNSSVVQSTETSRASTKQEVSSCTPSELIELDAAQVAPSGQDKLGQLTVDVDHSFVTSTSHDDDDDDEVQERQGKMSKQQEQQQDAGCKGDKSLNHLAGLRMLVIIWITIGHSFLYPSANNYQYYRSIINMNITRDSVWFATTNFTLGFDMLLYITGLCFVYKLFKPVLQKSKQQNNCRSPNDNKSTHFNTSNNSNKLASPQTLRFKAVDRVGILRMVYDKMLRFWPTYLSVIGLAIVVPLLADGPMWPEMVGKRIGASCRNNWWANLLFINNFLVESEICLPSSWFVSILMQLFLIGSVILFIVQKCSLKAGLALILFLLFASSAMSFMFAYLAQVRAPIIRMDESFVMELDDNIFRLYTNIFNNIGPFLIGMIGGFILLRAKQQQHLNNTNVSLQVLKSSPRSSSAQRNRLADIRKNGFVIRTVCCVVVSAIALMVLSSVFHQTYSRFCSSIYWSLHRVGWAIVTGYIIHNCATARWTLINDLLSISLFVPLNRLIPIAYLIYPIFIHMHSGLVRDGLHVSIYNMLNIYTTRLVMTFTTALLIHLLVELPFCSIKQLHIDAWFLNESNTRMPLNSTKLNDNKQKTNDISQVRDISSDSAKLHPLLAVAKADSDISAQFNMRLNDIEQNKHENTCEDEKCCLKIGAVYISTNTTKAQDETDKTESERRQ